MTIQNYVFKTATLKVEFIFIFELFGAPVQLQFYNA